MINEIVLAATILAPPGYPVPPNPIKPIWEVDWFSVPSGPLPWAIPVFPAVDFDIDEPDAFDEVEHSAAYEDQIADMEANYEAMEGPILSAQTTADDWIGGENLPDMTAGDFDTGLDPLGTGSMQASEMAEEIADNIGTVYQFVRLLSSIDLGPATYAIGFILLCIAWMILLNFIRFAIQIADMAYSVVVSIIELIPVVE